MEKNRILYRTKRQSNDMDEKQKTINILSEELLRVRTQQSAAAHQLDNLCIELGYGHSISPYDAASLIRNEINDNRKQINEYKRQLGLTIP